MVRLLKNHIYPTYQLHAFMANRRTTPRDGLRLGALITMEWLRQRLGDEAPCELAGMPSPSAYRDVGDECLVSLRVSSGFMIDIVSLPERGIWTLQIEEPDLGSAPGDPEQERSAVPGRIIETNVAFKITGARLECGFQTVISDPVGTAAAQVYRLAVVRRLIRHPDFGLFQLTDLDHEAFPISTAGQLKTMLEVWRDKGNDLPCVVFTRPKPAEKPAELPRLDTFHPISPLPVPPMERMPEEPPVPAIPYDVEGFARSAVTFCRTYVAEAALLDRLTGAVGKSISPGDIVLLEPSGFGGAASVLPWKSSKVRQKEAMAALRQRILSYPRGKDVAFGQIAFLSDAREDLLRHTAQAIETSAGTAARCEEKLARAEERWAALLGEKDEKLAALTAQLERQREYCRRLEREKAALREEDSGELARLRQTLGKKEADIAYLRRKLSQPAEHSQIAAWVEENFAGRLILHPKAAALLEDRSARDVSLPLICDALDFLATDYWERRYDRITTEEMNSRCSEKYGRPFEVKPTGMRTVEFTPAQYKVKYFPGAAGKPVESPLDFHLGVGNDPENLLRVYFLHDDQKKLIVVGSLPRHLRAVTIK